MHPWICFPVYCDCPSCCFWLAQSGKSSNSKYVLPPFMDWPECCDSLQYAVRCWFSCVPLSNCSWSNETKFYAGSSIFWHFGLCYVSWCCSSRAIGEGIFSCVSNHNQRIVDFYLLFLSHRKDITQLPSEGLLINCIGFLIVSYGAIVVYLVTERSYQREALPEDTLLLPGSRND